MSTINMSKCMDSKHKHKTHNSKNEMDRYEVIKLLGEGSFGRVYKAKVIADSSFVALKVICKARRSNKEIIGLRRECEIQRNLHHPNIIQMLDSFETASEIVVVTEFAQKELNNLLGKEGYLSEERASPIIWDLVSALFYLHSHRVLHRDLKPQNILIDSTSRAKLCDFGFARNMSTGTHVLTSIKGTPLYMAPELIEEQPYDYKADLWSLGCIMYELLVGAPPFCTASILHLIRLIRHEQIQWPTFVSENCISFLKGLLQKDPVKRITWEEIKNHSFVKGHILICGDSTNMPLTGPLSESTLEVKEQQRKEQLNNRNKSRSLNHHSGEHVNMAKIPQMNNVSGSKSNKSDSQDTKNNNIILNEFGKLSIEDDHNLARNSSQRTDKPNFIEENHPIETEEWIVFLQKSMEEVMCGDLTSLTQPSLTNIIVSPLRNTNTSSKVLNYVTKLLSISFVLKSVSQDSKDRIKKVYLDVKLVPNLVYSSKQIMKIKSENSSSSSVSLPNTPLPHRDIYRSVSDLTDVDIQSLEYIYTLITHLVHLDNEFLLQLCDSLAVLNVFAILRSFLIVCKSRVQIIMDLLAIFTHILRVFPENVELIEKIILNETVEDSAVNFVELLRYNHPVMQERACLFLQYLGKYLTTNKIETLWNEIVRETLEALMYDSNENVRNAADKTVDELKYKEFYKQKSVNII